jgi:hypothetical protein
MATEEWAWEEENQGGGMVSFLLDTAGKEWRGEGGSSTATTCRTEEGRGSGAALGCSADSGTTVAGTGGACYAPGVTIATTVFKQYLIM